MWFRPKGGEIRKGLMKPDNTIRRLDISTSLRAIASRPLMCEILMRAYLGGFSSAEVELREAGFKYSPF